MCHRVNTTSSIVVNNQQTINGEAVYFLTFVFQRIMPNPIRAENSETLKLRNRVNFRAQSHASMD
jgi:hypothetical protein